MIDMEEFEIFTANKSTLRELSKDDSDSASVEYMTESSLEAINFDGVKTRYTNTLGLSEETADSFDGILKKNDTLYFVEFKNGKMKNEKRKIKDKIRDGLLIFCDIVKLDIGHTRKNVEFILVYNAGKNPLPNQLKENTVQESPSRVQIAECLMRKGNREFVRFDLERFKKLYFKDVHTYTEEQFENFLRL